MDKGAETAPLTMDHLIISRRGPPEPIPPKLGIKRALQIVAIVSWCVERNWGKGGGVVDL